MGTIHRKIRYIAILSKVKDDVSFTRQKLSKSRTRKSARPHRQLLNRARNRINHPPPLSHLLCIFLFVGRGSLCSLRTEWKQAGERAGAQGIKTPHYSSCVLIGPSSPRWRSATIFVPVSRSLFGFMVKGGPGEDSLDGRIPSAQSHSQAEGRAAPCPT